jgi:hypothetical protein
VPTVVDDETADDFGAALSEIDAKVQPDLTGNSGFIEHYMLDSSDCRTARVVQAFPQNSGPRNRVWQLEQDLRPGARDRLLRSYTKNMTIAVHMQALSNGTNTIAAVRATNATFYPGRQEKGGYFFLDEKGARGLRTLVNEIHEASFPRTTRPSSI